MLKTILRWVPMGIFILLVLAALELNKNSLWGWAVTILLFGLYIFLYVRFLGEKPFGFKLLAFLGLLVLTFGAFMLSWPPTKAVPAVSYPNPKTTEIIELQDGKITGVYNEDGKVKVYTGIPYAQPPVGDLRWKEPQDPAPWDGILVCDHFAPMSMQPVNLPIYNSLAQIIGYHDYKISLTDNYIAPVSEDSLYLNIWQPAEAKPEDKLPVIVYIHGGSLQTGQPWYDDYSGETLAHEGVIVVNMGYRLGVFGFFADEELIAESDNKTTGNYGLLDQIKALEWVQKNIAVFGGDPSNVTVAGESAGSACV
ncbi:MAG: carboxylesterase family protein, partial [Firmicutes bacterium]|nr:carboxylesterase family protein [Bacillota bacterium]